LDNDLQLARTVSEAVLATDGVYALGTGRYVEAATYGAGEKVTGVVVGPDDVRVHIVVSYPPPKLITPRAEGIRDRVALRSGGRAVTVVVEDLEVAQDENL
jgi:hypothetical protein